MNEFADRVRAILRRRAADPGEAADAASDDAADRGGETRLSRVQRDEVLIEIARQQANLAEAVDELTEQARRQPDRLDALAEQIGRINLGDLAGRLDQQQMQLSQLVQRLDRIGSRFDELDRKLGEQARARQADDDEAESLREQAIQQSEALRSIRQALDQLAGQLPQTEQQLTQRLDQAREQARRQVGLAQTRWWWQLGLSAAAAALALAALLGILWLLLAG